VKVILGEVAERHSEDLLANEFVDAIPNSSGGGGSRRFCAIESIRPRPILAVAKQDDARVRGESMIAALDFDGAVEIGHEQVYPELHPSRGLLCV
jgi:hypothetical protein